MISLCYTNIYYVDICRNFHIPFLHNKASSLRSNKIMRSFNVGASYDIVSSHQITEFILFSISDHSQSAIFCYRVPSLSSYNSCDIVYIFSSQYLLYIYCIVYSFTYGCQLFSRLHTQMLACTHIYLEITCAYFVPVCQCVV